MRISNITKQTVLATKANKADTFASRMVGLLKHKTLNESEGLIITRCNSIHMFFMRFAIDVVFIDKKNKVVALVENIKPNRLSKIFWKASTAIELPVGVISKSNTAVNDLLQFQHTH